MDKGESSRLQRAFDDAQSLIRPRTAGVWFLLCFLGAAALWADPGPAKRLDLMAQDVLTLRMPTLQPPVPMPKIVLILLGERSLRRDQQWPWPRSRYAGLLEQLAHARLVVFDIAMPENSQAHEDAAFAEAVRRHGRVLTALHVALQTEGFHAENSNPHPVYPYRQLFDAAAGFGVVNVIPDIDGVVRLTKLLWQSDTLNLPSLALAVGVQYGFTPTFSLRDGGQELHWTQDASPGHAAGDSAPTLPSLSLGADYSARFVPRRPETWHVVEYVDVVDGKTPADMFDDAVVVVGVSGTGASDLRRMAGGQFAPGSFFIVNSIAGLWHGSVLRNVPELPAKLAALLFCALAVAAALRWNIRRAALIMLGLGTAWVTLWSAALWYGYWVLPLATPLLTAILLFSAASSYALFTLEREWAVRSLPMDAILLFPSRPASFTGGAADNADFAAQLRDIWPKIHDLCSFLLVQARATAHQPEVARCLKSRSARKQEGKTTSLLMIANAGKTHPRHRMLVPLPFAGEEQEYTVIGWSGRTRADTLKSVAALVVSLAQHHASLEEQEKRHALMFSTVRALTGAIDAKDPITAGHSERVASLARDLARWAGYPEAEAEEVFFAGILHDVGKIGVPDSVLCKEGKLTPEEFGAMKRHPLAGESIMKPIRLPLTVESGIAQHHERLDGKGYPLGLSGQDISEVAKILKIVDVYDALISERQYKKAWPVTDALSLLHDNRGTEFDARLVDVFLRHMAPDGWAPTGR